MHAARVGPRCHPCHSRSTSQLLQLQPLVCSTLLPLQPSMAGLLIWLCQLLRLLVVVVGTLQEALYMTPGTKVRRMEQQQRRLARRPAHRRDSLRWQQPRSLLPASSSSSNSSCSSTSTAITTSSSTGSRGMPPLAPAQAGRRVSTVPTAAGALNRPGHQGSVGQQEGQVQEERTTFSASAATSTAASAVGGAAAAALLPWLPCHTATTAATWACTSLAGFTLLQLLLQLAMEAVCLRMPAQQDCRKAEEHSRELLSLLLAAAAAQAAHLFSRAALQQRSHPQCLRLTAPCDRVQDGSEGSCSTRALLAMKCRHQVLLLLAVSLWKQVEAAGWALRLQATAHRYQPLRAASTSHARMLLLGWSAQGLALPAAAAAAVPAAAAAAPSTHQSTRVCVC